MPPGFTAYGSASLGFLVGLPLGWSEEPARDGTLFNATSPTEGTAFVLLDDRPIALDFDKWLADELETEEKIGGNKPTIEHVMVAGGPAIKDTTNMFGIGAAAAYYVPVPGKGVITPNFQLLDRGEPSIWDEIAATFGPW